MKKAMTITYEVDGALYVNMTNKCSNRCDFCIRNNGDGAYGSDSLWLEHEPTVEQVLESIFERDLTKYRELVFCGYGEPSYRLEDCRRVALATKERCPSMPVRINTNGQSDLILGCDSAPMYHGAFDTVSISLNTPNAEKYCEMCHPVYGNSAFGALLTFASNVKEQVGEVLLSVVRETLSEEELEQCYAIARDCGVTLKVRTYIPPEQ